MASATRDNLQGELEGIQKEIDTCRAVVMSDDRTPEDGERLADLLTAARSIDDQIDRIDKAASNDQEARAAAAAAQASPAGERERSLAEEIVERRQDILDNRSFVLERDVFTDQGYNVGGLEGLVAADQSTSIDRLPLVVPSLLNLFPVGTTSSDRYKGVREVGFTNNAAAVEAGRRDSGNYSIYGESDYETEPYEKGITKVGHYVTTDEDTLADAGQLEAVVGENLRWGIDWNTESQMLATGAQATNQLDSLLIDAQKLNFDVPETATDAERNAAAEALMLNIRRAKTLATWARLPVEFVGLDPEADEILDLYRNGNGVFLAGNPFGQNGSNSIFGLRRVQSQHLAKNHTPSGGSEGRVPGDVVVGSTRGYKLLSRQQTEVARVQINDDALRDMVRLKAKRRLIGVNIRPEAIVHVTSTVTDQAA